MRIRIAGTDDVSVLTDIIRRAFRDVAVRFCLTLENCPTHPSHCTPEWIKKAFNKGVRFFLLEDNGSPCGCAAAEDTSDHVMYLERLAVLPTYRRRGIGRHLVEYVCRVAREGGCRRIEIAIIADHRELKEWYTGLGFYVLRTSRFDHLPFNVTFMAMDINAPGEMA